MFLIGNLRDKLIYSKSIRLDRYSPLGNPFYLPNEQLRDSVCNAYELYFQAVLSGKEPIEAASNIAKDWGLTISTTWKKPSRTEFLSSIKYLIEHKDDNLVLLCWCTPKRCHISTVIKYVNLLVGKDYV